MHPDARRRYPGKARPGALLEGARGAWRTAARGGGVRGFPERRAGGLSRGHAMRSCAERRNGLVNVRNARFSLGVHGRDRACSGDQAAAADRHFEKSRKRYTIDKENRHNPPDSRVYINTKEEVMLRMSGRVQPSDQIQITKKTPGKSTSSCAVRNLSHMPPPNRKLCFTASLYPSKASSGKL